jgi:hypothetical protein
MVIRGLSEIPGITRDLSNRGIYFYLDLADNALLGKDFEFLVELPPEMTFLARCSIRCRGRVVRTDNSSRLLTGIAAEILDYSIQREAETSA